MTATFVGNSASGPTRFENAGDPWKPFSRELLNVLCERARSRSTAKDAGFGVDDGSGQPVAIRFAAALKGASCSIRSCGYILAASEVLSAIEHAGPDRHGHRIICECTIAETLRHWRERSLARRQDAIELYDERFARL